MSKVIENNIEWITSVWEKINAKLSKTAVKSRDKLPYSTINGVHDNMADGRVDWWTNGFWGGMMWLMYKETGNEEYKKTALRSEELMDDALFDFECLHHDVGFMWHILSGAHYKICGDKKAYNRNLFAAASLASRFNVDGGYIRAWNTGNGSADNTGWTIIDCMMNIPLLYWASKELGDDRFKRIAMHHADMTVRDHIRADGSVNHIVEHDPDTGAVLKVYAGQGFSETSCWSRGSAWAIYGLILSYIHTGKKDYLDACIKCANYFALNCIKKDYRAVVDFRAPEEPEYFDSTAGVCAACGLIELSKYVSKSEAESYLETAINILKATDKYFADYSFDEDALVKMGSGRYPKTAEEMKEIHVPIIYGDFFYVEAMLKLRGSDFLIW